MIKYHPARLDELVEHYMECRGSNARAISLAAASKAITTVMPDCPLRERDLGNLIAAPAARHGHAVNFDIERRTLG